MKINKEKFSYLSDLVKLNFTVSEETKLTNDLNQLLEFLETMNELDTDNVEPMTYIHSLENIYREDVASDIGTGQELLANAPENGNGCYIVPRIMD